MSLLIAITFASSCFLPNCSFSGCSLLFPALYRVQNSGSSLPGHHVERIAIIPASQERRC